MHELGFTNQPERAFYTDLPGTAGLQSKGILRGDLAMPVVVQLHGKPGNGNELLQFLLAHHLYEQGFASVRLSLYGYEQHTRNQLETTLEDNAQDFTTVVSSLRSQGARQVFGVGHSYGGSAILKSSAALDGAVLWEPTHGSAWHEIPDAEPNFLEKTLGKYVIGISGWPYVTTTEERAYDLALGDTTQWAARKGYPLKVISAANGSMTHLAARYIAAADEPKEHVVIPNASHQLHDSDEVISTLLDETASWLKNFTP
jgi:pimeloyl-ACP methyl ester carboxylesterase